MNRVSERAMLTSERAFTLSEVTMSVGIVSAILLPILGLLATGTRLSTESQDQAASSVIATKVAESFRTGVNSNVPPSLLIGPDSEINIQASGGQAVYTSFNSSGDFVRVISEDEYQAGLQSDGTSLYLAKTHLEPAPVERGAVSREYPLLSLKIMVEFPAMAAKENRSEILFTSRVSSP